MTESSKIPPRFSVVATAPPDSILGLNEAFAADTNPEKMNLSVGVYKDVSGQTPVLRCVKAAEQRLVDGEKTKGYLPIDGQADYRTHVRKLVFGDTIDASRIAVLQTPGGTGALRESAAFLSSQIPGARVWISNPTWANHQAIFASENVPYDSYRYLAADKKSFDVDGMIDDLTTKTRPGDAVLLHACCHNPTGVDPTAEQWNMIAALLSEKQLLPIIDFAYQGFGHGLDEDAVAIRAITNVCDEAIVCSSFSKNFGLYSERVGAVSVVSADSATSAAVQSQLKALVRSNYSNPPRHGAAIVATILDDADLTQMWHAELTEMRTRIRQLRSQFVETMKTTGAGHDFSFLLDQNGMFSFSGLNPMQVDELRQKYSIYIVGSGRINVAGMSEDRMDHLCKVVAAVIEG
ncbi:amino acid aminotransferase [Rubripirellula reticaptiva]|uniref:Aspartate aminotransferase n=1 Tax=Rubripirellula reticaptiva TaxID=2528013 RepID=A0A5C6FAF0_9BACT|nr:amino acid aminotransferase [Rubripirellula reticaptiva]TWU57772.1 Aspartate aminotransferase [Rubripirellula reticaptiva]